MAGGDHRSRHPYGGSTRRKVCPTPTCQARMDAPPQTGFVILWVSSQLALLLTWACLFAATLTVACCLVQGFLELAIERAVIVELREQLLTREHGVVEAERDLGRACMECDTAHDRAGVVKQDYHTRLLASTTDGRCSLEFDRFLSGCQFVLSVQGTYLKRREK
jgi:hypothetical protein